LIVTDMWTNGESLRSIAKALHISVSTAHRDLHRFEVLA
jgi:transposase